MMVSSPPTDHEATSPTFGLYSSFSRSAARSPSARYLRVAGGLETQHRGVEVHEPGIVVLRRLCSHDERGPQLRPSLEPLVVSPAVELPQLPRPEPARPEVALLFLPDARVGIAFREEPAGAGGLADRPGLGGFGDRLQLQRRPFRRLPQEIDGLVIGAMRPAGERVRRRALGRGALREHLDLSRRRHADAHVRQIRLEAFAGGPF